MLHEAASWLKPGAGDLPDVSPPWRRALAQTGLALLGLMLLFAQSWAEMADQWWNSSTYSHILLVPLILGWLVWQRVGQVLAITPRVWMPGLALVGGALFVGLLGRVSGLNVAHHLAAVLVLQAALLTLLGPRVVAALLFPLFYMIFLVPIGDELVPSLQTITAKITIALTNLSGIEAQIDGVFIDTPVGLFEVAEACSGVKFLVAMVALGALVAHLCFQSWRRRAAFMLAAVVVPILANGLRAWSTIYIAQFVGVEFAAGVDHIIYGWVFFAIVMALLLALGWKFFDRDADAPAVDLAAIEANSLLGRLERGQGNGWAAVGAIAALSLLFGAWQASAQSVEAQLPARIDLPSVPGWHRVDYDPVIWWEPRARGADHRLLGRYRGPQGQEVDVFFALYAAQDEERDAGAYGEGALTPDTAWSWLEPGKAIANAHSERLLGEGRVGRVSATFYRTGSLVTGSNARLKLASMLGRLSMRDDPTMMLILSSEEREGQDATAAIADFRHAAGDTAEWMDHLAKGV